MALGVLAVITAAVAFYVSRRKKRAPAETYGGELYAPNYALSKQKRSEMPADEKVHEKDSAPVATHPMGELEAPRY